MLCLITYDLKLNRDYPKLDEAINRIGDCWHYLGSVCIVKSPYDPVEIAKYLKQYIDDDDSLLVVDISDQKRAGWLRQEAWDWFTSKNV